MKKLIAALVLATSFAAFADDAAKAPAPAKTEKKTDEKKTTEDAKTTPAPAAKPAPPRRLPRRSKPFRSPVALGGVGLARAGSPRWHVRCSESGCRRSISLSS